MTWQIAQDTFNAELDGGGQVTVTRGSHWPEGHEVVKKDGGRQHLFKPASETEEPPPMKVPARGRVASAKGA